MSNAAKLAPRASTWNLVSRRSAHAAEHSDNPGLVPERFLPKSLRLMEALCQLHHTLSGLGEGRRRSRSGLAERTVLRLHGGPRLGRRRPHRAGAGLGATLGRAAGQLLQPAVAPAAGLELCRPRLLRGAVGIPTVGGLHHNQMMVETCLRRPRSRSCQTRGWVSSQGQPMASRKSRRGAYPAPV